MKLQQRPDKPAPDQQPSEIPPAKSPHIDIPQPDAPPGHITTPEQPVPVRG